MQFYSSLLLATLGFTSFAHANEADTDFVACTFNNFRSRYGLAPIRVAQLLVTSSNKQASYMQNSQRLTTSGPAGISAARRLTDVGYPWSFAQSLVGQVYRTPQDFANAMIRQHKNEVLSKEVTHMGVGHTGRYWDVDFAAADGPVRVRHAKCPERLN